MANYHTRQSLSRHLAVSVVIPAFNEEAIVGKVVSEVNAVLAGTNYTYEVLVVDDGSEDATSQNARVNGARVIRHPYNKGNGAAVKTGIREAQGEVVILMDGDGQHNPQDILRLLARIPEYDMVVGARRRDSDTDWYRKWGNTIYNWLASYLTGFKIEDLTSGFRAFRRELMLRFVPLFPNSFSYPTTCTTAFIKAGYNVLFVPVHTRRRVGRSKIKFFRDGMRFFLIIARAIMLFHPLKVFVPFSLLSFVLGVIEMTRASTRLGRLYMPNSAATLIEGCILLFLMGLMAEQIATLRDL